MANYNFRATNVTVVASGVQENGKNAGKAYAVGNFVSKDKTRSFTAFDSEGKTAATRILELVEAGTTEMYLKGEFQNGKQRDPEDASKGHYQEFNVAFVDTVEERAAFVEQQKAARAEATADAE